MSQHHRKRVSLYDANKLYYFPSVRKSLFSTKTFIPLIFIHPSQKKEGICTNERVKTFFHGNLSNIYYFLLGNISFTIIQYVHVKYSSIINFKYIYVMCMLRLFLPFFFYYYFLVLIAFHISRMISCNVACNDGTFVGLLKRNQEFFPFFL